MSPTERVLYRILDANYNRSKEAFRVIEDILRFGTKNTLLTRELKRLRHELTSVFMGLPRNFKEIICCRDISRDKTKNDSIQDKKKKISILDIVFSNIQRVEESLRVIEECSKPISASAAAKVCLLRFKIYDLEKRIAAKF